LQVEGSECAFLSGASKMIANLKPTLIIEVHPRSLKAAGATGAELKQLLQGLGYKRYAEINHSDRICDLEDLNTDIQRNIIVMMA